MRFLADECCHAAIVAALRAAGHDTTHIQEIDCGAPDEAVLARAAAEDRILVTEDKDFGELVVRQGASVPGLVLLRLTTVDPLRKAERLLHAIEAHGDLMKGHHVVVLDASARLRPLLTSV